MQRVLWDINYLEVSLLKRRGDRYWVRDSESCVKLPVSKKNQQVNFQTKQDEAWFDMEFPVFCSVFLQSYMVSLPSIKQAISVLTQSCLTLYSPMDCSMPGSSAHGILQARILEKGAISYSRGSSWARDRTHISSISCFGRQVLYH